MIEGLALLGSLRLLSKTFANENMMPVIEIHVSVIEFESMRKGLCEQGVARPARGLSSRGLRLVVTLPGGSAVITCERDAARVLEARP